MPLNRQENNCFQAVADSSKLTEPLPSQHQVSTLENNFVIYL